jgi:hypothetical protein
MTNVIEAVVWAVGITVLSQAISIGLMRLLGLSPRKLAQVIEDEQNPAVGAVFFIVALITALYLGLVSGDGYDSTGSNMEDFLWIVGGVVLAFVLTSISFMIAYRVMKPVPGENFLQYVRREIVTEQNVSLAFYLGALAIAPFMAAVYQIL